MMFSKLKLLVPAVVLLWMFAGCGGGGDSQPSPQKSSQPQATSAQQASALKGDPAQGKTLYMQSCSACHGPDARGLKGLGKDLVASQFVQEKTDMELLDYVNKGRGVDDPLNTTGIPMPPKGGNPALSDQNIMDIIAYLRTIHE